MASGSNIEWTDATWNPMVGCTPVSPGCLNCYAATMARRLEAMGRKEYAPREPIANGQSAIAEGGPSPGRPRRPPSPRGGGGSTPTGDSPLATGALRIAEVRGGRAVFTGLVREVPDRLDAPLHWKKPRRIFVNSMSDLFHEAVSFEFIDRVFAVMALCPQHTFQVLTKRPERMAEYFYYGGGLERGGLIARAISTTYNQTDRSGMALGDVLGMNFTSEGMAWPITNVWLGTSVEDQQRADERIPHLLRCPAAVRFLSCEPLVGKVDLSGIANHRSAIAEGGPSPGRPRRPPSPRGGGGSTPTGDSPLATGGLHWVIVGGESGAPRDARPCNVEWIRSIVEQCKAAGVPCFVKQLGARPRENFYSAARDDWERLGFDWEPDAKQWNERDGQPMGHIEVPIALRDRKGGDPAEWPEDLRVRALPATWGTGEIEERV